MSRLGRLGEPVPLNRGATLFAGAATAAAFAPIYGFVPSTINQLAMANGWSTLPANMFCAGLTVSVAPFLVGRLALLAAKAPPSRKRRYRGLKIGPIRATERDLYTSMLVLGSTGSGKTSRVMFPALEDFVDTYADEDDNVYSKNPYQKLGGFVLEVKGKFFETLVLLVHRAGRNAATDVRVIRANSTLPVAEFRDEQGRRFFLNAQPCSSGSEVARFYKPYKFKDGAPIESDLFKRIRQANLTRYEPELKEIEAKVSPDVRFVGWRWKQGKLHRVRQTLKRGEPEFTGEVIDPPKILKYHRTLHLTNGLRYNLIDPYVPSSEAADRISMVAKMVTGEGKGGGDNQFFYTAAAKAIDAAIRLQRIIAPKVETTVLDVYRIIAQDSAMQVSLTKLTDCITVLQQEKIQRDKAGETDQAYELGKLITSYTDLGKFFTEEWLKLKSQGNTGTSIMSTISNLFGPFMREPALQETFCQPATFTFNDCMQKGTIFAFVPGPEFEMNARLIGTVLKMDWQSRMLRRVSEGSDALNKNRVVLYFADECQKYIVSGSQEAGDPNFMSLSRESRVIHICATQSEAWVYSVLSKDEARVYLQSFGTRVWLTQTDTQTNREAAELCGQRQKEKRSHTQQLDVGDIFTGKEAKAKQTIGWEDKARYEPHEFAELKEDECVCFNKGEGMLDMHMADCKAVKGKIPWRWITSDDGVEEIADRMRWWFCETWENEIFNQGRMAMLDPIIGTPSPANGSAIQSMASIATPTAPPTPATPPPATPPANAGGNQPTLKPQTQSAPPASPPTPPAKQLETPPPSPAPKEQPRAEVPLPPPAPTPPKVEQKAQPPPPPASAQTPEPAKVPPSPPQKPAEPTEAGKVADMMRRVSDLPLDPKLRMGPHPVMDVARGDPKKIESRPPSGQNTATPPGVQTKPLTTDSTPVKAPNGADTGNNEETITPAEIARQEAAYQELLATNPFILVDYKDFAGLDQSRQAARQRSEVPAEDRQAVGPGGSVGGNTDLVKKAAAAEGAKADTFRVPTDLLAGDPAEELLRRTVSSLPGTALAPDGLKSEAKETRGKWSF